MTIDLTTTKKFIKEHRVEIAVVTGIAVGVASTLIVKKMTAPAPKLLEYTVLTLTDELIDSLRNDPGLQSIWENIGAGHVALEYVAPGGQINPMPNKIYYRTLKN